MAGRCFGRWTAGRSPILRRYPSGTVASFGFLTPVLAVGMGWAVLSEPVSPITPVALILLTAGLFLINRRGA